MIVALAGRKNSGKTTAAEYIASVYDYEEYALAEPMKEALRVMFGFTEEQLYGKQKEEVDLRYGISPRQMLQTLGTEWGQHVLQDAAPYFRFLTGRGLWVKRFFYEVYWQGRDYVISDVRFQHEILGLQDIDDVRSVWIEGGEENDDHESEPKNLKVDVVIHNDGEPEELYDSLDILMESLSV